MVMAAPLAPVAAAPLAPALALRQVAAPKASATEMVSNSKNIHFVKTLMKRNSGGLSLGDAACVADDK